ncbi:MAG TPA: hypothetical protein PKV21_09980 [bacterium]|nr:hypothetical protein [bacterium]
MKKNKYFELLVDSGTIYSVILKEELKKLIIKLTSFKEFVLANGETIEN